MSIPSKCGGVLVKWLARQTFDLKIGGSETVACCRGGFLDTGRQSDNGWR